MKLNEIVNKIINKGILAADERPSSLDKRFRKANIDNTLVNRNKFREILFTTKNIDKYISAIILNEETKLNIKLDVIIGIKVDKGIKDGITQGIEDLDRRISNLDCSFTKWRCAIIDYSNIDKNCELLAEFAKISQNNNKVPIVEPEILYNVNIELLREGLARKVYSTLFMYLNKKNVDLTGIILKISFLEVENFREFNIREIEYSVPSIVRIVYLSGGHSTELSFKYLKELKSDRITFSFGRALTNPVLNTWKGKDENIGKAQEVFLNIFIQNK